MKMFILEHCPHCNNARKWIKELQEENSQYQQIEVTLIDEEKQVDLANSYDYYYVPAIFDGNNKLHEGVASKEKIEDIFETLLK